MLKTLAKGAGFGLALGVMAGPALATETIKAVVIDGYPARALWVQEFTNFFIPEVDKRLAESGNYKMDWQESYGGTIVKPRGVLEGIELGLGDIGIVTTIFHSSKLPSQAIAAVTPFVSGAGMNLRYLEGIENAAGVRGGLTDFYNMLQTGLVDHALLWPESAATFKIAEVAPFMLKADLGAVNSKTVTVNKDYWDGLPDEVKEALLEVAVLYRDHVAGLAMDKAEESLDAFVASGGTVVEMDEAQRAAWARAMPNIAQEWARDLEDAGQPGTEMLNAYMAKLRDAGFTPVRDWAADSGTN
ncbi:MAG: C4-dicarboxylate ABC transporter [Rhodobacteraceae bacterium]|nr:MAG: C4-dicarboxylate ABC transporter [Paracoccaceae bacterium]